MPELSAHSKEILATCHPQLIRLVNIVVLTFDVAVICGHRGEADQMIALKEGKTHLGWPHSKHNKLPSEAVDIAPYPIDWLDREKFVLLGGYVLGMAEVIGIPIRWGGDWNGDRDMRNQKLHDLPHFELNL